MPTLRSQLIGTWSLVHYYAYLPASPTNKHYPLGLSAQGIIMYTPDGYMSAQLLTPGQQPFKGEGQRSESKAETEADWATAGRNYAAYSGEFYLDETPGKEPILMHHMRRRVVRMTEEDGERFLNLGLEEEIEIDGEMRVVVVKWRRMRGNEGGVKPPAEGRE